MNTKSWLYPTIFLCLFLVIWQFLISGYLLPEFLFPKPSSVFHQLFVEAEVLWKAAFQTATCAFIGLALSLILGLFSALVFASVPFLNMSLMPFSVFFQTVPIIAVAPLLVIWFGFGEPTVIASAFIVSFFPILASALTGLAQVNKDYLDLASIHRFSKVATIFRIRFPFAISKILVGLKISGGLSIIGAIVGEFIAGGGIGSVIDIARTQQKIDLVFAAIIVSSLMGIGLILAIEGLTRWIQSLRPLINNSDF